MNVLILTPDRVGSTLLQRLITVYMLRKGFDHPVINLHELTNGLIKYYNPVLSAEILGKPQGTNRWGYFQKLPEVIDLLKSVQHYKTSRLAHYHIINRKDSVEDQLKFYEYLNKNFYVISCRRENLFEHALSWVIYSHSKHLNVYSPSEKVNIFRDIYTNGIIAHKEQITNYLRKYKNYIDWTNRNFDVQSYFEYDKDIKDIENYILNLDFMRNSEKNSWEDMFGQSWKDYNTCARILPNLILNKPSQQAIHKIEFTDKKYISNQSYDKLKGHDWPNYDEFNRGIVPAFVQKELRELQVNQAYTVNVDSKTYEFLKTNLESYQNTSMQLSKLVEDGFLVTPVPLKLQSLREKRSIILNYTDCLDWYNNWVDENNFGIKHTESELNEVAHNEEDQLNFSINKLLK